MQTKNKSYQSQSMSQAIISGWHRQRAGAKELQTVGKATHVWNLFQETLANLSHILHQIEKISCSTLGESSIMQRRGSRKEGIHYYITSVIKDKLHDVQNVDK